jgi:hypothetical protein
MPTLKILMGAKVIDAELVVHEGNLVPRVPDEHVGSTMPAMTAKLEAQVRAADSVIELGDIVRAAGATFPQLYPKSGDEHAKRAAKEYQVCKETYGLGEYDVAREKLTALKGQVQQSMIHLEMMALVEKEMKARPKSSKKVKVTRTDGKKIFHMAARFDGDRLWARLLGAKLRRPIGVLLELPKDFEATPIKDNPCSCECNPSAPSAGNSVGYQYVIQEFRGASLDCDERQSLVGMSSTNYVSYTCSVDRGRGNTCYKSVILYFPGASS